MTDAITEVLSAAASGDATANAHVYETIYGELHKIARSQRRQWQGDHTVNTTALIHEAYLKLLGSDAQWSNRKHFYATAARAMRQVLVSYARARTADKRGGADSPVSMDAEGLDLALLAGDRAPEDLLALDEALSDLEARSERQCRVVECRFFAGLSLEETAEMLGISIATVKRDWLLASVALHELLS